jgi:hypothetical protein
MDKAAATARVNELIADDKTDFSEVRSVDWFSLGATLFYTLPKNRPPIERALGKNGVPRISEGFLNFFDETQAQGFEVPAVEAGAKVEAPSASSENHKKLIFEIIRKKVLDGILLMDGLLQQDRASRIDLDRPASVRPSVAVVEGKRLRAKTNNFSVMQIDSFPTAGKSCSDFLDEAAQQSAVFQEQGIKRSATNMVSFLEGVC